MSTFHIHARRQNHPDLTTCSQVVVRLQLDVVRLQLDVVRLQLDVFCENQGATEVYHQKTVPSMFRIKENQYDTVYSRLNKFSRKSNYNLTTSNYNLTTCSQIWMILPSSMNVEGRHHVQSVSKLTTFRQNPFYLLTAVVGSAMVSYTPFLIISEYFFKTCDC